MTTTRELERRLEVLCEKVTGKPTAAIPYVRDDEPVCRRRRPSNPGREAGQPGAVCLTCQNTGVDMTGRVYDYCSCWIGRERAREFG